MNLKPTPTLVLAGTLVLAFTGCGKPESRDPKATINTRETSTAQEEIAKSRTDASPAQKAEVELAFANLEKEIVELEVRVAKTEGEDRAVAQYKLDALKNRRDALRQEYNQARFDELVKDVKSALGSPSK